MASAYMGSIKRMSAAGKAAGFVAFTLGMLLYSLEPPEANCEPVNASITSNSEEYRREQKQAPTRANSGS